MKTSKILLSAVLTGSLALTSTQSVANAEEEQGAKTVWGETLPSSADTNGDGWANVGFDPSGLPQSYQNEITNLTQQKDKDKISQIEYNEQVASIYEQAKQEQQKQQTTQGERPYGGFTPDGMTQEEYQELENNVPNPNSVSTEKYNQVVKNESQKIADEGNKTINTPQGELKPTIEKNNKSSENVKNQDSNSQVLPETGKGNQSNILSIIGASGLLIVGVGLLLFRKKLV
ncbi:LPXTG cell wall anchor domain-containing protein [Staphylococcus saprophyticus]|nr:LPXTG cell wall anchor domain-containing protein [Staphylococcus saprophyticus]